MKNVQLSADNQICVYSVPDKVAEGLHDYCMEFCCNWLRSSPDAVRYRVETGDGVSFHYTEKDFVDYLSRYICDVPPALVKAFPDTSDRDDLPEEYAQLPYFNF